MSIYSKITEALSPDEANPGREFKSFEPKTRDKGSFKEFEKALRKYGLLTLIIGKRGSGKTALGMKLLSWYKHNTDRKCYGIGYMEADLPRWIKKTEDIETIPNNSVVLIDEAAILFFSRESMKSMNKTLSKIMSVARHKNLSLILITQSSAMVDLNVLRLVDVLLFKEPSLLQERFERQSLRDLFQKVDSIFKDIDRDREPYFYVFSDEYEGLVQYDLPYFWNDSISRAFKEFEANE
ncbi:MAG: AAA family ATPase [Hadesarchaea archaeon]|nr:AAA family ATPase [Hadesarchaea archaeon]